MRVAILKKKAEAERVALGDSPSHSLGDETRWLSDLRRAGYCLR
jgi:hypothetical protein